MHDRLHADAMVAANRSWTFDPVAIVSVRNEHLRSILQGQRMIVKTKTGHQVKSEEGKNLSKPDLTLAEAKKRLEQVEYFKRKGQIAKRKKM